MMVDRVVFAEGEDESVDDVAREEHSSLDSVNLEIARNGVKLRRDHFRTDPIDGLDSERVLRCDRRENGGAVDLKRGKGFEIRLNSCSSAAVGTGDREDDGRRAHRSKARADRKRNRVKTKKTQIEIPSFLPQRSPV